MATDEPEDHDERSPADGERAGEARPTLGRRSLMIGGGALGVAIVAAASVGAELGFGGLVRSPGPASKSASKKSPVPMREFVSTRLTTPKVTARTWGRTADGYLFVDPKLTPGGSVNDFSGLVMENSGEPVWIEPTGANLTDLRVQSYRGDPVLTYWSGKSVAGHGEGHGTILDTSYRPVAQVYAGNGIHADLHEFNLTDRGTALVTSYPVARGDIRFFGGPADGYIYDCHIQEIDVATGHVLLDWTASDHIAMSESFRTIGDRKGHDGTSREHAFDPFHLNAVDDDGDRLLISSRYTKTIYAIDRNDGTVLWRFGGRRSDFAIPSADRFAWQHDIRHHPDGTVSLFDNHRWTGKKGASRGMVFRLDEAAHTAELVQSYAYDGHLGNAMGSTQLLAGGNVLVGWGTDPSVTEFTADGEAIYEADDVGTMAYRANRSVWTARPTTRPDVGVSGDAGAPRVHASWNGATEVAAWRVRASTAGGRMRSVATAERSGFETSAVIDTADRVSVEALDASGAVLATSPERPVRAH